jgi:hypothetical protein
LKIFKLISHLLFFEYELFKCEMKPIKKREREREREREGGREGGSRSSSDSRA